MGNSREQGISSSEEFGRYLLWKLTMVERNACPALTNNLLSSANTIQYFQHLCQIQKQRATWDRSLYGRPQFRSLTLHSIETRPLFIICSSFCIRSKKLNSLSRTDFGSILNLIFRNYITILNGTEGLLKRRIYSLIALAVIFYNIINIM